MENAICFVQNDRDDELHVTCSDDHLPIFEEDIYPCEFLTHFTSGNIFGKRKKFDVHNVYKQ